MTSADFQKQVYTSQAPGVPGDFASANPYFSLDAGPNGLIAGPNGLIQGRFAWVSYGAIDADGAPAQANNYGTGPVAGIVPRLQDGLITTYLAEAGNTIPAGFECTIMTGTDFWVLNSGSTSAYPGQIAYANFADGRVTFAAANAPAGATSTSYTISAQTNSFNGSASGNILTVTDTVVGAIVVGTILTASGLASGTQITQQLSGTAGGIGTYALSIGEQSVPAATAFTGAYGLLTTAGTITGSFGVGDVLSGTGVTTGTVITQLGTGTGGAGTYYVSPSQTASSGTITSATNIQTAWVCMTTGAPGEIVKISKQPLN